MWSGRLKAIIWSNNLDVPSIIGVLRTLLV